MASGTNRSCHHPGDACVLREFQSGMLPVVLRIAASILLLLSTAAVFAEAPAQEPVRRILASRCWACHAQAGMGGLRLDSREAIMRGGKSGPAVVPGKPEISRLIRAVKRADSDVKAMPP